MPRGRLAAVAAAMFVAMALPLTAGEWQYDPASDLVFYGAIPVSRWYGERPSKPTGLRTDGIRVQAPPRCPHRLCGYPLPIHEARRPAVVGTHRVTGPAHVEWCAARYRSYDAPTDTWQPYHGPRRHCRSPYR